MGAVMGIDALELSNSIQNSLAKNTELIAYIRTIKSNFKIALLSNVSGRARLEQLFDDGELDELFDAVIASGDVGIVKPERAIYELAVGKLGLMPEECVMIDDLSEYCEGAEAVGMRSIQFLTTVQARTDLEALIDSEQQTD
jgi:putative hydrolase of the HAD superfamily